MMKQLLVALIATFLLFVPNTYAHTNLDSTNPTDGATVTEEIQTIDLNYSGKIEEGSIFKVLASDGSVMAMDSITLNDGVLTGTLASPLPNDTYTVEWDSISQDGHPLSGSFSFTVNAPVASESADGTDSAADTNNTEATETATVDEIIEDATNSEDANSSWALIITMSIILIVLVVIVVYSYYRLLIKRKKNK